MPELRHDPEGTRDERPMEWTLPTLYVHLSRIVADQGRRIDDHTISVERTAAAAVISSERALQAALIASEKAIAKAELASEKRFDSVNEFRGALTDQAATFVTRHEIESTIKALTEKIDSSSIHVERIESKAHGASSLWGYLIGGFGVLLALIGCTVGVISFILNHSVQPIQPVLPVSPVLQQGPTK